MSSDTSELSSAIVNTPTHDHLSTPLKSLNLSNNDTEDFDLETIQQEQLTIDKTLNFLINCNPNKRRPGRPPKRDCVKSSASPDVNDIPDTVSDNLKNITDINNLHAGILLDYLKKVHTLNKKLFISYQRLTKDFEGLKSKLQDHPKFVHDSVTNNVVLPKIETKENEERFSNLQLKLDDLEQKNNSNVVLCTGSVITDILNDDTNIQSKISQSIKSIDSSFDAASITKVTKFGKNNNALKISFTDIHTRRRILSEARKKKRDDLFFSEFLTAHRNNIFYQARTLKKTYPDKLSTVYVRNGSIYYKLTSNSEFKILRTLQQITTLRDELASNNI